jgi:hypothetical protein
MLFVLYLSSISLELSRDLLERQELNTCRIQTACIIIIFDGYTYSFKLGIALWDQTYFSNQGKAIN